MKKILTILTACATWLCCHVSITHDYKASAYNLISPTYKLAANFSQLYVFSPGFATYFQNIIMNGTSLWNSNNIHWYSTSSYVIKTVQYILPSSSAGLNPNSIAETSFYYHLSANQIVPATNSNGPFINWDTGRIVVNPDKLAWFTTKACAHEIGHVFGLDHNYNPSSIMYPSFVGMTATAPSIDDRAGLYAMYGLS